MLYLVNATHGPSFGSPEEMVNVLKKLVIPTFEKMIDLKKKKKILAGGLPVGERAFVCIVEADSNDELDKMLRTIPMWPLMEWETIPLQSIEGRAESERKALKKLK